MQLKWEYTKVIHVNCLRKLLRSAYPCHYCPTKYREHSDTWLIFATNACAVCCEFVGIDRKNLPRPLRGECPCNQLGKEEAIKRTLLALEEYDATHNIQK